MNEPTVKPDDFPPGKRVRIMAGTFEGFEATVEGVDQDAGKIRAGINVFGTITPVELEPTEFELIDWLLRLKLLDELLAFGMPGNYAF